MDYRAVIVVAILINACHQNYAKLNVIPRDTEVKINDSTYMNCSTSLRANLIQWRHGKYYVYTGIAILEPYNNGRFSVDIDTSIGTSNLVIRSVQPTDAGKYECLEDEGFGEKGTAELIVLDADPFCKSNVHLDGVIGPNSCDVIAEEIRLSCSIKYHGNVLPVLQWKANGDNDSITNGLFSVTSNNNEVTYSLTIKSELDINNCSFICQTMRTSKKPYTCSSNTIHILYVFSSILTMNMTLNDEVSCFANTSQSCNYKWKWFNGDDSTTESENQVLKPMKVGWYRCEATCSFGNKLCVVESMQAKVHSDATTNRQNWMPLLTFLLLPPLVVIGVIIYRRKKQNPSTNKRKSEENGTPQEQTSLVPWHETLKTKMNSQDKDTQRPTEPFGTIQELEDESMLIRTLISNASSKQHKAVFGLAILGDELFVSSFGYPKIEVFGDLPNLKSTREFSLTGHLLEHPWDMQSSSKDQCLYIVDVKRNEDQTTEIIKMNREGNVQKKWPTDCLLGLLSVTKESNVIVTSLGKHKIKEYSSEGHLIRLIELPSDVDIVSPWITLKRNENEYMVSHGNRGDYRHGVSLISQQKNITKYFGGKKGSSNGQLNIPVHISANSGGYIFIADKDNRRVVLLSPELKYMKTIYSQVGDLRFPYRVCLDEQNKLLFVSENLWHSNWKPWTEGRVLVLDVSKVLTTSTIALETNDVQLAGIRIL